MGTGAVGLRCLRHHRLSVQWHAARVTVIGIDGYRGGWVAARAEASPARPTVTWATSSVHDVASLLDPSCVIGIDMPIGLAAMGWRACDVLAKSALGRAGSRVFMTPPRAVLELGLSAPNEAVQQLSRETTGQGTSRQAMGLAERILALDAALSDRAGARDTGDVIEVHPELAFAEMAGQVLAGKKTAAGVGQRVEALGPWLPSVVEHLASAPADVPVDDALDALACAWSASRWRISAARTLPEGASAAPFIVI